MKKAAILLIVFFVFINVHAQDSLQQASRVILPLQFMQFEAKVIDRNVQVLWTVSSNEDARNFEIERSVDDGSYQKVGSKLSTGQIGTVAYEFVDALPKRNIPLNYRVKIIGKDGSIILSDAQQVKIEERSLSCKLKQNPVYQTLQLEVASQEAGMLKISVYANDGQKELSQLTKINAGSNQISISSQNLHSGIHRLVIEMRNERRLISFVKE